MPTRRIRNEGPAQPYTSSVRPRAHDPQGEHGSADRLVPRSRGRPIARWSESAFPRDPRPGPAKTELSSAFADRNLAFETKRANRSGAHHLGALRTLQGGIFFAWSDFRTVQRQSVINARNVATGSRLQLERPISENVRRPLSYSDWQCRVRLPKQPGCMPDFQTGLCRRNRNWS
jgi:hypothetical protein